MGKGRAKAKIHTDRQMSLRATQYAAEAMLDRATKRRAAAKKKASVKKYKRQTSGGKARPTR